MDLRNPIRNALHKELKIKIASIIKHRISQANLNCTVLEAEPCLRDHYEQRQTQSTQLSVDVDAPEYHLNAEGRKVRADLAIHHHDENRYRIVDFSFTEPTSSSHLPYNKVGQAAERQVGNKLREYQHWDLDSSEDSLTIFGVETFGIVSKSAITFLESYIGSTENKSRAKPLLQQQLSVALHSLRAQEFLYIQHNSVSIGEPALPLRNRNNRRPRV
jgi:hypothetical protein